MSVAVVQAHPLHESYNGALLARVVAGLERAGPPHQVFRLADGARPAPKTMQAHRRLVLVYPTWWGGQPAVLLDWLQEMLCTGALRGVDRLEAVTSLGSSRLLNTIQGQWGRRYLADRVRGACAPGAGFAWHALYKIDRQPPEAIAAFLAATEDRFATSPG